jgi:DTW domain-containing protein
MGRRNKRGDRCESCRIARQLCLCKVMPRFDLEMRLCLVMHCREIKKPTATGPMALSILSNSELYIHGIPERPLDLRSLSTEGRRVLVLFPGEGATALNELDRVTDSRPISLVVPDGNWRQASRVPHRVPGLREAELVTLPQGPETAWGIRRETREGGLATFEAIARAIGWLESLDAQREMENYFDQAVRATLQMRGGAYLDERAHSHQRSRAEVK